VAVEINGGTVDRGDMARVDVFRRRNKKGTWEFHVVPIYPHQIVSLEFPPNKAVIAYKAENDWTPIDSNFEFAWSLHPMSYLELVKSNGELIEGYYRSMDRTTGAINLSPMATNSETIRSIGVKTLSSFRKFSIDRVGRKSEIPREVRTWRGEACT
jgi:CRISPR-associated endonuclease Csn1